MNSHFFNKSHLLGALLIVALFWIAIPARTAFAATVVTNTLDSGVGSLRSAITMTSSGGTITFGASLSGQTIRLATPLALFQNVTIDGSALASPIIVNGDTNNDGTGDTEVFRVLSSTTSVHLKGLTITWGRTYYYGGGVYNLGTLTVTDCTISNNRVVGTSSANYSYGGGIYNDGTLTVTNSTFTGNTSTGYSGSLTGHGGAIYSESGDVTVTNSTFSSNVSYGGGGIVSEGTMAVAGSTFTSNGSGAIRNGGTMTLTNSTFTSNTGGALSSGTILADGYSGSAVISNSTFANNHNDGGVGGAIQNSGTMTVTNSTFSANSAGDTSGGGGPSGIGGAIWNGALLTLTNSTFSGNIATEGGAIYLDLAGTLNYTNTILANSSGDYDCYNEYNMGTIGINTQNLVEANEGCGTPYLTTDPNLGTLASNGGPTQTMALLSGSPAINAGDDTTCAAAPVNNLDQRGVSRPQGDHCDIGAYEAPAPGAFGKVSPINGAINQGDSVTLVRGSSDGATSFEYCFYSTGSCSSWSDFGSLPNKQINGLDPNTTYYWHVRATNGIGNTYSDGNSIAIWSFTTGGAPTAFQKSGPTDGALDQPANPTLSWTASSGGGWLEYHYCFSTTNPCVYADETYTNGTSVQLSSLLPDTTYYWNVRAVDAFGNIDSDASTTDWSFRTGLLAGVFNKSSPTDGAINQPVNATLTWSPSSNSTSYAYCYGKSIAACAGTWTFVYGATNLNLSWLSPSTTYYWNVMANNSFGSTFADGSATTWSFTTGAAPVFNPNPGSWNFGLIKVGVASAGKTFIIKNTGGTDMKIGVITLTGSGASQFHLTGNTCSNQTVVSNGTCIITATFKPTTAGAKTANINIPDNSAGNPHHISLSGKGGTEQSLNGGFNIYSGGSKIPTSWAQMNFSATDGKDTVIKKEGLASVWIANTSTRTKTLTQTRLVSGGTGSTFTLSLWGKGLRIPTSAGAVQAQVMLYSSASPSPFQTKIITFGNGNYSFTQKSLTFTATHAYNKIIIKLTYSKGNGSIWFDGLSLLRSP